MRIVEIEVGTINIPVQVGPAAWEKCWEKTADQTSLFGSQESFSRAQKRMWRRLSKQHGWGRAGVLGGPNPVFFDKDVWSKVSAEIVRLHGKSGRKTKPGFNDARYMTDVVLDHRHLEFEVAVLNVHWTPPFFVPKLFLLSSRRKSKKIARQRIREHTKAGRIVIFMGDTNIGPKFKLANVQWLRGRGIDKLGIAIPSGWSTMKINVDTFPAPTDHKHGVKAKITLMER